MIKFNNSKKYYWERDIMMMKNMKIGKKLILIFILVGILSSVGGIVGLSVMTNMNSNYSKALTLYGFSQGDIGLFNTEFNNSQSIIRDLVSSKNVDNLNTYSSQLTQSNNKMNTYFANIKKEVIGDKELSYYNDIKNNLAQYEIVRDRIVTLALENKATNAQDILTTQGISLSDKIRISTNALITEKTVSGNKVAATLNSQETAATIVVLVIILISFIISLMIALRISRGISKPIKEMVEAAQKMAKGDLSVHINVNSKDEIGQLGTAFSETIETIKAYITDIKINLSKVEQGDLMIASDLQYKGDFSELQISIQGIVAFFNDIVAQMRQASEQVSSGSEQVSNGAQALAQGATEQASSIEELSASIMEISTHVKDNSEHAVNASLNVNHVSSEIEISNKYMSEMVGAMSQINDSSSQIGKIIKAIEDIAFQTNILALNAAVEAARAGSAGKGFAVVADEVRNLASKSAEAAKNTTLLIKNSMKQVENGTKIAGETAKSLLRVVEGAKAVADTVDKISKASSQQAVFIDQVMLGVEQISDVVQTNSATAEESAAASEELSGQAQALKTLVKKFKLTDETN
jgi:Methyl-accepting chemotaxis protein